MRPYRRDLVSVHRSRFDPKVRGLRPRAANDPSRAVVPVFGFHLSRSWPQRILESGLKNQDKGMKILM